MQGASTVLCIAAGTARKCTKSQLDLSGQEMMPANLYCTVLFYARIVFSYADYSVGSLASCGVIFERGVTRTVHTVQTRPGMTKQEAYYRHGIQEHMHLA
jgi:hypothetical protein